MKIANGLEMKKIPIAVKQLHSLLVMILVGYYRKADLKMMNSRATSPLLDLESKVQLL